MAAYVIGMGTINDPSWRSVYREKIAPILKRHGGRYLTRSDAAWEVLEGHAASGTTFTVIEFPSVEHARAWYHDPEYQPLIPLRQAGSKIDYVVVPGTTL